MKRNCNLELRLVTPSIFSSDYNNCAQSYSPSMFNGSPRDDEQLQKMTIFYNGRVASSDVTELQARAIILLASREMMEQKWSPLPRSGPTSPPIYSPTSGLSMKRSLQSFLQKRKSRVQATSPYPLLTPHNINHHPNSSKNC